MNPILFENYLALPESLRERYLQQLFPNEGDRVQFRADLNAYLLGGSSDNSEDSQAPEGGGGVSRGFNPTPTPTPVPILGSGCQCYSITNDDLESNEAVVSYVACSGSVTTISVFYSQTRSICVRNGTTPSSNSNASIVSSGKSCSNSFDCAPVPTPTPIPVTVRYYELNGCNGGYAFTTIRPDTPNQTYIDPITNQFYVYTGSVRDLSDVPNFFNGSIQKVFGRQNCTADSGGGSGGSGGGGTEEIKTTYYELVNCNGTDIKYTTTNASRNQRFSNTTRLTLGRPIYTFTGTSISTSTPPSQYDSTFIPLAGLFNCPTNTEDRTDLIPPVEPAPSNDQYFLLRECTNDGRLGAEVYTQIRGDEAQRYVDTSLRISPTTRYYYFVDGADKRFGLPPKNFNPNLRPLAGQYGCPSVPTIEPTIIIEPTPTTTPPPGGGVAITFLSVIAEDLAEIIRNKCGRSLDPMLGSLNLGSIILDGVEIGSGQATATLVVGTSHTVVFNKPSHPYFTFSDGSPSSYTFTVSSSQTLFESYFYPSFSKIKGLLSVRVNLAPNIAGLNIKPKVFITNVGQIGEGSISNYSLDTGDYTLYFEPIKVAGMIFVTPSERKISINICTNTEIDVTYTGVALPTNYWLKKIDSIDQMKYNSVITKGMFSNGIANMVSFYKSSISDSIDNHYTHVYHERTSYATSSIQFSLAYGHSEGSGSNDEGGQYNDTPTRAIYGQYKNIIIGNSQDRLNLSGTPTKHFYVVSYQKDRRDTRADYNALELNIAHLSGSQFIASSNMRYHTGSNVKLGGQGKVLRLISDYKINDNPQKAVPSAPLEYNIVSGSVEDGVYNTNSPHYYGKLYPSLGVVLLDANKLDISASFGTVTSREIDGKNQLKLFTAVSGAALYTDISGDKLGMKARATEEELTYYYYIHVKNKEFNFSNNPSIYNTDGLQYLQYGVPNDISVAPEVLDNTAVLSNTFINRPTTYITTIGLYDENRNLVAVGKVSKAELNNFTEEVMFTVKLKF